MKLAKLYAQQKKALKVLMCGALCVALSIGAYADYDPDVNYMLLALDACCAQDVETGTQLMEARNEKIASEGIEVSVR